ncbi:PilT/PilU family type 4a pilus ATPase [Candidatus Dojkabacteria bacterium]|nr:PilT/PilU family type 4a pilus ATPase [Candidatus Dojkabacteria bacterium]
MPGSSTPADSARGTESEDTKQKELGQKAEKENPAGSVQAGSNSKSGRAGSVQAQAHNKTDQASTPQPQNDITVNKGQANDQVKTSQQSSPASVSGANSSPSPTGQAPKVNSTGNYPYTISQLLDIVIQRDASDLHISVDYPAMLRVDGDLTPVSNDVVTPKVAEDLILPILEEEKRDRLEVNREVDLAYDYEGKGRFRVNAFYQRKSMAAALRLIPSNIRTIDELGLPGIYHQLTKINQGFVLVTGPTGSGKTTTLAALLQEINMNRACHILTIEDPIEYVYEPAKALIAQREVGDDTHSWQIAMKSALREDPDVVLVGEMRDYETIASAITLAETGHLVFATLHTNNAAQTIDRIIDVFPEHQQNQVRAQLSNIIEAVIAQRLVPLQSGGRTAVSEIMLANPAVRNLIREAKTHQIDNVIRTSADVGMISLEHSLVKLVRENQITMEVAQRFSVKPEEIVRLLKS